MVKYLLGTKIGMTRLFKTNGRVVPCTVVYAEPNVVLEVKTAEKNGAKGVKVGYLDQKENKVNKPHAGIFKKVEVPIKQYIRTFSNVTGEYSTGDLLTVEQFKQGQYVDVQGTTKGRGYTGAIFRWNKKIGPLSHGAGYPHRWQGSIAFGRGGSAPQRVAKGHHMHGHYGHETVTIQNLNVVLVDPVNNLILISGAIPGPEGSLVTIKTSVKNPNKVEEYNLLTVENKKMIEEANKLLENKEALEQANNLAEEKVELAEEKHEEQNERKAAELLKEKHELEEKKEGVEIEDGVDVEEVEEQA